MNDGEKSGWGEKKRREKEMLERSWWEKEILERSWWEKEILEKLIPSSILIGPFQIITSKIREALASKRKQLAETVLNFQTRKVRTFAEDIKVLCLLLDIEFLFPKNE